MQNADLQTQLQQLESKFDQQFKDVYDALNYLIKKDNVPNVPKECKTIGYKK